VIVLGAIASLFLVYLIATVVPYLYAVHLESKWRPANPQTRAELERHLHLYSTKRIEPRDSMWGNCYELHPNEQMIQYSIMWCEPLDVVYDDQGRIQMIFTSYE